MKVGAQVTSYVNACRLERRPEIQDRIGYLTRQEDELVVEKLWTIHEADIGDLWETYEATKVGKDGKAETDEAGNKTILRTVSIQSGLEAC